MDDMLFTQGGDPKYMAPYNQRVLYRVRDMHILHARN